MARTRICRPGGWMEARSIRPRRLAAAPPFPSTVRRWRAAVAAVSRTQRRYQSAALVAAQWWWGLDGSGGRRWSHKKSRRRGHRSRDLRSSHRRALECLKLLHLRQAPSFRVRRRRWERRTVFGRCHTRVRLSSSSSRGGRQSVSQVEVSRSNLSSSRCRPGGV